MIDIETRKIVDLLNSREHDEVTKWLKTFPNIQIVSRDGSITYKSAIKEAHPNAIQISDRFHLLKNLTDYCKEYLLRELNINVSLGSAQISNSGEPHDSQMKFKLEKYKKVHEMNEAGFTNFDICKKLKMQSRTVKKYLEMSYTDVESKYNSLLKKNHDKSVVKKEKKIAEVRKLSESGYSICEIMLKMSMAWTTVKKYLDPKVSAVHRSYGTFSGGPLQVYHDTIDELLSKGTKYKEIEETIRKQGYKGSSSAIRMYGTRARHLRKGSIIDGNKEESIGRKNLIKLLYSPLENVKGISSNQLTKFLNKHPCIEKVYKIVKEFKKLLFDKDASKLESWLEEAASLKIDELSSFVRGIKRDIEAVKNAIIFAYSNGLAEGSVNKIKVIKRIMYGRSKFDMLRRKVLLLEKRRKNN